MRGRLAVVFVGAVACTTTKQVPQSAPNDASAVPFASASASASATMTDAGVSESDAADQQAVMLRALSGVGAGGCDVRDDVEWWLRLDLRAPRDEHRRALLARAKALPGTLYCGPKGTIYLSLSTKDARGLLGKNVSFSGVSGAGNTRHSCQLYASIEPESFVAASLAADVQRIAFNTDPKLALVGDLAPCVK